MNKGAQWATFHGAAELDMTEWLSTWFFSMFLNCLDDSNVKPKFVCLKKKTKTKTLLLPLSAADLIPHFHENQKLFDEKSFIFLQESTEHCLFYLQILSQIGPHFTISTHSPSLNHHHLLPDLTLWPPSLPLSPCFLGSSQVRPPGCPRNAGLILALGPLLFSLFILPGKLFPQGCKAHSSNPPSLLTCHLLSDNYSDHLV